MQQEMSRPHSDHCFYCTTCSMTLEEVTAHIQHLVQDAEVAISARCDSYVPNCKFLVNMPLSRDGKTQKHCYLWVTNKEVHRMLSGLNYDGRKIVAGPAPVVVERRSAFEELQAVDWADMTTTEFQPYEPPKHEHFTLGQVAVERVGRDYVEGKLFCAVQLPKSYPTERLQSLFQPFVTSGYLSVIRSREGDRASIAFSNRDDAYFALCMRKKYYDEEHKIELAFNYCKSR